MLLILRLVLVPLLIAAVTLAGRRWGQRIGAFVTALPAVAGPTLGFYAIEQGRTFAAAAASGSMLGLVGVAAFCLAYARASLRLHWSACLFIGWGSFAVVSILLYGVSVHPLVALLIAVVALFTVRALLPAAQHVPPPTRAPRWDLPLRMLSAATLVFCADIGRGSSRPEHQRHPHAVSRCDGDTRRLHARAAWIGSVHRVSSCVCPWSLRVRDLLRGAGDDAAANVDRMVVCGGPRHAVGVADGAVQEDLITGVASSPLRRSGASG